MTYDNHNYPNNLLIAMINNDKTHFAVEFAGNIKCKRLSLAFDYNGSKYKDIMTIDSIDFVERIISKIVYSVSNKNIEDQLTAQQKKEYMMKQRLKTFCEKQNLVYKEVETNSSTIDCYINNIPIQLKYTSQSKHRKSLQVTLRKSGGRIGKKVLDNHITFQMILNL